MRRRRPGVEAGQVVAALGPTNTGKTHRAITRMLSHRSGMLGLPLRLLAREVYDRVTGLVGEARVALVTGEEKRIPDRPAYWVCTTEAMPIDHAVDFLGVDEIQLAANADRGHVFTDRLLHARGRRETWFLGAETIGGLFDTLIPQADHQRFRRMSRLRYAEPRSLRSLPPRTAVVAFSAEQVYELAERLRRLQGGVAVVLGALSPRTRNAQVAMYQAGEVDHLVATDAIGMGLNLDIDHVVFAGLRKFDGRAHRALRTEELAQIAGRAGRHVNDGTFGTLKDVGDLPFPVVDAIEGHRFRPLERLVWRNPDLDFGSPEALVASLLRPPPHPVLRRVERADDFEALSELIRDTDVRARATDPNGLALLWEVCQIPDFRKLLLHQHARLLREIFLQLTDAGGRLDPGWLDGQIRRVSSLTGGIDALTARLSAVRTWTYVSHRGGWLDDPTQWQARTRALEDALGDALHERLVERFVERAGGRRGVDARGRPKRGRSTGTSPGTALRGNGGDGGSGADPGGAQGPFAALRTLLPEAPQGATADDAPPDGDLDGRDDDLARFVHRVVEARHGDFAVGRDGIVRFEGVPVARLVPTKDVRAPGVALIDADDLGAGERRRLDRRLLALGQDLAAEASGDVRLPPLAETAAGRGFAYALTRGLGALPRRQVAAQWRGMSDGERSRFTTEGAVVQGRRWVFVRDAVRHRALERRAILVSLVRGGRLPAGVPDEPVLDRAAFDDGPPPSSPPPGRRDDRGDAAHAYGYEPVGPQAFRIDVVEGIAAELAEASGDGEGDDTPLLDALDLPARPRSRLLAHLGYADGPEGRIVRRRSRRSRAGAARGGRSRRKPSPKTGSGS